MPKVKQPRKGVTNIAKTNRQTGKTAVELTEDRLGQLTSLVGSVRSIVQSRTRPYIVELSGTPKSGKTTTVTSLDLFLRRNGFDCRLIGESGSISPIQDKRGFSFNAWTAATTLSWLLEAMDAGHQFILIDRGLFDCVVWAQWHVKSGNISAPEKEAMEAFFLLDRFRLLVDLVFVMTARPKIAIEREHRNLLTKRPGRIMNEATLDELHNSALEVLQSQSKKMRVEYIDTSDLQIKETAVKVVEVMLQALKSEQELLVDRRSE